jgi:hypothetical protein
VSWTRGPFVFAAGQEKTLRYWFPGRGRIPEWRGPQVAVPDPNMLPGGTFVATAQGSQNAGQHEHDPEMKYPVTIKNRGGAGKFTLYGGGLT